MSDEGAAPATETGESKIMPLFDHLDELRSRLIKSFTAILIIFAVAMFYADKIIGVLKVPLAAALPPEMSTLHFTGPMDVFVAQIKVGVMVAIIFACPAWLFQVWRFIEPALYPHERKYAIPFLVAAVGLFFGGIAFAYFLIIPMAMEFLIGIGFQAGATPIITINDYISILTLLIIGFGVVFELPVVIILLAVLDIVSLEFLVKYRKLMMILILVIAAVLTPPDPISQVAMAVPMLLMYEMSIIIVRIIKKGRDGSEETKATA
jgi:sec-independent protein translocase protein TatC